MKDKSEILQNAMSLAIKGGWDCILSKTYFNSSNDDLLTLQYIEPFIFNHDFAESIWGKSWDEYDGCKVHRKIHSYPGDAQGDSYADPAIYHLMEMVSDEDPIIYLGDNLVTKG